MALATLSALLLSATIAPHPADRPYADLTLEVRPDGVRATVLLNFQFIDLVLGTRGEPTEPPSAPEAAEVKARILAAFARRNAVLLDGTLVAPRCAGDFVVAEPQPALREAAPGFVRALTQVRFSLDYEVPEAPARMTVTWGFYPLHPLTEAKDSPLVPMELRAVLVRDSGAEVLDFRADRPSQTVVLAAVRDAAAAAAAPVEAPPPLRPALLLCLAAAGLVLLLRDRRAIAVVVGSLVCMSCGDPRVLRTETRSWSVTVLTAPDAVVANELFTAKVSVTPKQHGSAPTSVRVDADMPAHRHGMNTAPRVTPAGEGSFLVDGLLFHMPGAWELYVDIGEGQQLERAVFPVELR